MIDKITMTTIGISKMFKEDEKYITVDVMTEILESKNLIFIKMSQTEKSHLRSKETCLPGSQH